MLGRVQEQDDETVKQNKLHSDTNIAIHYVHPYVFFCIFRRDINQKVLIPSEECGTKFYKHETLIPDVLQVSTKLYDVYSFDQYPLIVLTRGPFKIFQHHYSSRLSSYNV